MEEISLNSTKHKSTTLLGLTAHTVQEGNISKSLFKKFTKHIFSSERMQLSYDE